MNFSVEEINNMTTHESSSYINQFKEVKTKEKESLEKAKQNLRNNRLANRSSKRSKNKRGRR